jgi:succinate dehydrogenase / fumarate reductase, iron-sulfur subunit
MNVNGRNALDCIARVAACNEPVVLRPLPGLPVIRDLILDMAAFYKRPQSARPCLLNNESPPHKEWRQAPEVRE